MLSALDSLTRRIQQEETLIWVLPTSDALGEVQDEALAVDQHDLEARTVFRGAM